MKRLGQERKQGKRFSLNIKIFSYKTFSTHATPSPNVRKLIVRPSKPNFVDNGVEKDFADQEKKFAKALVIRFIHLIFII